MFSAIVQGRAPTPPGTNDLDTSPLPIFLAAFVVYKAVMEVRQNT